MTIEPPENAQWAFDPVSDKADIHEAREAIVTGVDIENGDCKNITRSCTDDVYWSGKRVNGADPWWDSARIIVRSHWIQIRILGISSSENDCLARLDAGCHRNVVMNSVDACAIVSATVPFSPDYENVLSGSGANNR